MIMLPQHSQQLSEKTVFHKPYNHKSTQQRTNREVGKKLFMCAVVHLVLAIIITMQYSALV